MLPLKSAPTNNNMDFKDLLNKSQRYAESLLAENGYCCYLLPSKPEDKNEKRVGLLIRGGRVADYKVG
jgi:hypothetical protein